MPKNLKRLTGRNDLHFVTFSCYHRLPLLNTAHARDVFAQALEAIRNRYHFQVVGYVVMPEHVHLLITEPPGTTPSEVLKVLKQRVSRDLRKQAHSEPNLPQFWQTRFYDFNVYTTGKHHEKLEYMHNNPVKRGLTINPVSWLWSSSSFYEQGHPGPVTINPI